jgi:hypothetical protein
VANVGTADQLAEAFGLGRVTGPITAIERSWAGEVWSLPSDRGLWAATQLFEWTPVIDQHLDDEVRLVEAARSAGLAAPLPVRSTDGRLLVTIGDHRRAFLAGYRSSGIEVPTLDSSMFTTAISATLNWTATRINVALTSDNEERRQLADREVPLLLANPPSRQRFHRMLEAVS